MAVEATSAIRAFENARYSLREVADQNRIGGERVLRDIQDAVRNFGQGVEGMWTLTARDSKAVPSAAAHDLLIDLKNLGVFEGAARVARQRSGYMRIPHEQHVVLRTAWEHAGQAIDLLERSYRGNEAA